MNATQTNPNSSIRKQQLMNVYAPEMIIEPTSLTFTNSYYNITEPVLVIFYALGFGENGGPAWRVSTASGDYSLKNGTLN